MATALGHKGGFVAFGEESTWGTAASRTKKLRLRTGGDGVDVSQDEILSEEIPSINLDGGQSVIGNKAVAGSLMFDCQYEGHELIYKHALGSVSSAQPDATNASSTYRHTFTIADALPEGLTFEIDRDTEELVVEGGKINTIEWACDLNGLLICTIGIVGEDANWTTSPTAGLTYPTAAYIKYSDQESSGYIVTYNSAELKVTSLRWTLNNMLDVDRRFLGSNLISEPLRSAKIEVTGTMTVEFEDSTEYDDFIAHTERALVIQFDGATIESTYVYREKHSMDKVRIRNANPKANDEGRMLYDLDFKAYYEDSSNKELEIELTNTVTSV